MSDLIGKGRFFTLFGLVAGAAVGAAVALVYSPHKGEKNIRELNQWAHNRLEEVQRKVEK
jgi:gas vesicle protein